MKRVIAGCAVLLGTSGALGAPLAKPAMFAVCGVCHKVDAGTAAGIGPNLWGVGGRVSGTAPGFTYSPAMKAAKITWTKAELITFITDPQKRVPGTKMTYGGLKNPAQTAAIADYLISLK